ncbi:MAG TPA: fasciclin domain-containing protein [Gemmataceae bacterium]|nr:fasciclin domain-containing protein [Gemmataceae bacterium]
MMAKMFAGCALALMLCATTKAADEKTIAEIVAGSKDHTILLTAVKEAGLAETLGGKGPFTVFAPTDEAFKKLGEEKIKAVVADKELLKKILLAHVITDKAVMAADVGPLDGKEVNGFKISTKDGVMIGEAKVTKADIKASNGVVHVIDTVLVPSK